MNIWKMATLMVVLTAGACGTPSARTPSGSEVSAMTATHPGTISFDDKTTGRQWTEAIADLPETMAWVQTSDPEGRIAVARIEITGAPGQRRITKFAADGTMLESTPQAPPPPASPGP